MRMKKNITTLLFCVLLLFLTVPTVVYASETTEEHTHSYDDTGKCNSCDAQAEALVTVGGESVFQETMDEAIIYAQDKTEAVIKVLTDLEIKGTIAGLVFSGGTYTLDLNGKTISSTGQTIQATDATLTIMDSATGGTIQSTATSNGEKVCVAIGLDNSNFTLTSGKVEGEYAVYGIDASPIKVTGGTVQGRYYAVFSESGMVTVEGGNFITTEKEDFSFGISVKNKLIMSGSPVFDTFIAIEWGNGSIDLTQMDKATCSMYAYSGVNLTNLKVPEDYSFFDGFGNPLEATTAITAESLILVATHIHNWTYAAEGTDTITFTCNGDDKCETKNGRITIKAPANLTYDGEAKEASLEVVPENLPINLDAISIVYTGNLTDNKPVNVGEYTASITVSDGKNDYKASVDFTITETPAEEHTHNYDETGQCSGCESQAEASVTIADGEPVFYETIAAAINYAQEKTDAVIKVLTNLDITADPTEVEAALLFSGGSFTLDLNGKTISSPVHTLAVMGAELTIVDSATGGTIQSESTGGESIFAAVALTNGAVTLNSGKLEGEYTIYSFDASPITVTGGTLQARYCTIYSESGTVTVEGGNFITTETEDINGAIAVANNLTLSGSPIFETIIEIDWAGGILDLTQANKDNYLIYTYKDMSLTDLKIPEGYFITDASGNVLTADTVMEANGLIMVAAPHTHDWSYAMEGTDTIRLTCNGNENCLVENKSGTITIKAPADLTYNGEAKEALLELVPEGFLTGLEETTIVYTGELTEGKPVNAGDYTAFFTLVDGENEYQAKVSFTIVPLSLEGAAVTLAETEYNYDGRVKEAEITSVLVGSSTLTAEDYTISYLKNGKAVTAPKEAGIYTVRIQGKGNYTGKLETELIILPAQPKMMIKANPQTQSPGKNVAVSVTIANPWNPQLQDTPKSTLTYQIGSQKPQQFTDSFVIPKDTAANTTILITATTAATANYAAGEAELKLVVGACKHSDGTELRGEKEATATEAGYTGDTYCKSCGGKLSTGKDIPAKGTADKAKFPFTDVPQIAGNWKYESVYHVWEGGIMNGISGTTLFRPDHPLTRAMFATVLYRMAGSPAVTYSDRFTDVVDGEWYSKAIIWANEKKIVDGYTNGSYGINDNITREQIAKMLYLYGSLQGYKVDGKAALDSFTDASDVSGWAVNFMRWAVDAQMITGKPNGDGSFRLDPKGEATRAECAKMLMMFRQKYVK